jgi:V8-like Glu-specific endopeptidase
MPILSLRVSRVVIAVLLLTVSIANAEEYKFPGSSFGQLLLLPNQTTGGNDSLIAAQKGGAFEAISEFNADDRYRQFSASVARLDMLLEDAQGERYVSTCTANLIAIDVLLTNHHCIPGHRKNTKVIRANAVFDYLREDQVDAPKYKVDVTPIVANEEHDFAILQVAGKPGNAFGFFKLQPTKAKANESLFIIHHPAGMPKRLTRFRCKAYAPTPYSRAYFRHRCDTLGGSSGSLIFNMNFEVVALHNQGGLSKDSTTSFNRGISIYSLLENSRFSNLLANKPIVAVKTSKPAVRNKHYLLDNSSTKVLRAADVAHFNTAQLRLARNEVFARHGYQFSAQDLNSYFNAKQWYKPLYTEVQLNETERKNVSFLRMLEREKQAKQVSVDTRADDYLLANSATQRLSAAQLKKYSKTQLKYMRNEIFARHGYVFSSRQLQQYFEKKSWYQAQDKKVRLSSIEQANVNLLRSLEQ